MNKTIGPGSFELEETIPGSFILQGVAAGVVAGFFFVVFVMLWRPNTHNFFLPILCLPYAMAFGVMVCVVKGTIIWALAKSFGFKMRIMTRLAMAVVSACLICTLLAALGRSSEWTHLAIWMIPGLLTGVPTAVLVGSSVRPWRFFTFGTVAVRLGAAVQQRTSKSKLALLGILPLRLACTIALTVWAMYLAYLWPQRGQSRFSLIALPPTIYLVTSLYLSFRSPRRGTLLVVSILLNAPLIALTILCYGEKEGGYYGDLAKFLEILSAGFLLLWAIFLVTRLTAHIARPIHIAPAVDERVVAEDRSQQHLCLGSRFTEWEMGVNT